MTPSDQRTTINGHSAMMAVLPSPQRTKAVQNQQSDSRPISHITLTECTLDLPIFPNFSL